MKNIVLFTGAGMSAESGLKTFRDADGLWENHAIRRSRNSGGISIKSGISNYVFTTNAENN